MSRLTSVVGLLCKQGNMINNKNLPNRKEIKVDGGVLVLDFSEFVTKSYLDSTLDQRFKEWDEGIRRYMGALMEDNQHRHEQLIESFKMQYEMFARYIDGNEQDKVKINSRLNRLESKVLLA